jgi:hypothetical protein
MNNKEKPTKSNEIPPMVRNLINWGKIYKVSYPKFFMSYKSVDYRQSIRPDPWRRGRYGAQAHSEIYTSRGAIGEVLEDAGYILADADQWGETYRTRKYPGLEIDVDDLDSFDGRCLMRMRRANLEPDLASMELEKLRLEYEVFLEALATRYYDGRYQRECAAQLFV